MAFSRQGFKAAPGLHWATRMDGGKAPGVTTGQRATKRGRLVSTDFANHDAIRPQSKRLLKQPSDPDLTCPGEVRGPRHEINKNR